MSVEITGIFGLILLILDIWAIIRTAQSSATGLTKFFWVILILILPLLGFIFWLFLGPKTVHQV